MLAKIEGDKLVLTLDLAKTPRASKSGKSLTVASTNGNVLTSCEYMGQPIKIGVNAFIPVPDEPAAPAKRRSAGK